MTDPKPADRRSAPVFTGTGFVLLRTSALPRRALATPPLPPEPSTCQLRDTVAVLAARPALREAVALASPSLAGALDRVLEAAEPDATAVRRVACGLAGYAQRMTHRPTPFGLFAGVVLGTVGDTARARIGTAHRKRVRPDVIWLSGVARRVEPDPVLLRAATLVRVDTVALRAAEATIARGPGDTRPAAVRLSPPVAAVLRAAAVASPHGDLVDAARAAHPGATRQDAERLVAGLVELGFLAGDLVPAPDAADPLGHLLDRLGGAADHPLTAGLTAVRAEIDAYERTLPGASVERLTTRLCAIEPAAKAVHVDLLIDASVTLPAVVVVEAARAAEALWRMSPHRDADPARRHIRRYHTRFVERYGLGRVVPLDQLLGPAGLGLPAAPRDGPRPDARPEPGAQLLAELVHGAVADGSREVVLADADLDQLAGGAGAADPPPSLELYATLRAASVAALDAGEFRLALGESIGTRRLGASFGRFAHLLGADGERVREAVRAHGGGVPAGGDAVRAALICRPRDDDTGNVMITPDWLDHTIRIGPGPAGTVPPADLGVLATPDRLRLMRLSTGQHVLATRFDLVRPSALAAPVARFLDDLTYEDLPGLRGWDWGGTGAAPFLPRVRWGRTCLSPARWNVSPRLLGAGVRAEPPVEWRARFTRWRERVGLPATVLTGTGDQQLLLDLDDGLHLLMLRRQCARVTQLRLLEVPGGEDCPDGWLAGPHGPHTAEVVFPLVSKRTGPDVGPPRSRPAPRRGTADGVHLPGGEWLFAKIYVPPGAEVAVLRQHLPELLDEVLPAAAVDRWFFVRYADPEPHLRLRLHARPDALCGIALPALHRWADALRRSGHVGGLVLADYDQELERYGGPEVMADAERAFTADSVAVLDQLRLPVGADPLVVAAAGIVDLVRAFGDERLFDEWAARPVAVEDQREFRSRRAEAVRLVDPAAVRGLPWGHRRVALAALGAHVSALTAAGRCWTPPLSIVDSLVHLHCNRLFGPVPGAERRAVAVARAALRARAGRIRALGR